MTKYLFSFVVFVTLASTASFAQFRAADKGETLPSTREAMTNEKTDFISSILDPSRWDMHQQYSMSVSTMGGQVVSLTSFTNTFLFHASDAITLSADVSAVYSPYNTLGERFSKEINGIYLSSARLDWKLGKDTFLRIEVVNGPGSDWGFNPFSTSATPRTTGWNKHEASLNR